MTVQVCKATPWPRVSVVMPTLNEARNLPHVFALMPPGIHEIIVVDGRSVDDTLTVARQLRPDVRIVRQTRTGKGNALACGFAAATGDVIVTMDADGSADPGEIPKFVRALLDGADFAKGTRYGQGAGSTDITRLRSLGNRFLSVLVNVSYGTRYSDLCYGFNAFWRRNVPVFGLDGAPPPSRRAGQRYGDGFEIETLINIRAATAGLAITEVPSCEHPRIHGASNLSALRDGWRALTVILREKRRVVARGGLPARGSVPGRVTVVGPGWRFTSGVSHYTYRLATELADEYAVSVLLLRRLVPRRWYPGASRVGADLTTAVYPDHLPVYDGVDWYWGRSLTGALKFIDQRRPEVVVFQWWTGAALHTYLRLARYVARRGARVIVEWHEGQDVGEAALPGARRYVRALLPRLLSRADAHVFHSEFDLRGISAAYSLGDAPVRVIPHGPYEHLAGLTSGMGADSPEAATLQAGSAAQPLRLLYLGVVRPFKGVEDLVEAFSALDRAQAVQFRLTIVGETWEGWTAPDEAIARSPHRDLIDRVDRYVSDAELAGYFARADAVVLPYHRSSASGPLQIAMSAGLPVVVTAVGGLVEAVRDYQGALLVPPRDSDALRRALLQLTGLRGRRYADPHSWKQTVSSYGMLFDDIQGFAPRDRAQRRWPARMAAR